MDDKNPNQDELTEVLRDIYEKENKGQAKEIVQWSHRLY